MSRPIYPPSALPTAWNLSTFRYEIEQIVGGEMCVRVAAGLRFVLSSAGVGDGAVAGLGKSRLLIGIEFAAARSRMKKDDGFARREDRVEKFQATLQTMLGVVSK